MRRATAILQTELWRSPFLWAIPLLVFIGCMAAWRGFAAGVGYWPTTSVAILGAVQLMGPITAGLAAWCAARERRCGIKYLRETAALPPYAVPILQLTSIALLVMCAYLVVGVVIAARTIHDGGYGVPSLALVVHGLAGLILHAALGYIIGWYMGRALVLPFLVVCAYLIVAWNLGQSGHWWYLLSPVTVERFDVFSTWNDGLPLAMLSWIATVLALVVTSFIAALSFRSAPKLILIPLVLTIAAAAIGNHVAKFDGRFFGSQPAFGYICRGDVPTVCVHPAFVGGLTELQARFAVLGDRLAGTPGAVNRLEQRPRGVGGDASPGASPFHVDSLGRGFASKAVAEYVEALPNVSACFDSSHAVDGIRFTRIVAGWLADAPVSIGPDGRVVDWFDRLGEVGRRAWLAEKFSLFLNCELSAKDFQ